MTLIEDRTDAVANVVIGAHGTRAVAAACERAVARARVGQTFVLTSDVLVGTTRELLVEPLRAAGFDVGRDVFVAFSAPAVGEEALRMVGGYTSACALAAAAALRSTSPDMVVARTPEAAELAARLERSFQLVDGARADSAV